MNASDVVGLLEKRGIYRTESAIKSLASRFDLYLPKESPTSHSGLDPDKVNDLIEVLCSPLLISRIAKDNDCPYSRVNYYIMKLRIVTIKKYGFIMLENEEDLKNVQGYL